MTPTPLHRFSLAVLPLALLAQGCSVNPYAGQVNHLKQTFASDDPCSNNARNVGMLAGAVLGAVAGHQLAKKDDRLWAAALGAGLGAGIGNYVGSEMDQRRCALARIQQKYGLDMQVAPLQAAAPNSTAMSNGSNQVGLSVTVVDSMQRPQFGSGSADLSHDARMHFSEIARQYATNHQLAQLGSTATPQQRQSLSNTLSQKRVLLIGHTDDTGDTRLNADLSERRAKTVAEIFRLNGVSDAQLFYQGAGETLPLADNHTSEGRARNRRVEIVDLSNEETFRLYLSSRRANTGYYRSAENTQRSNVDTELKTNKSIQKPVPVEKAVAETARSNRTSAATTPASSESNNQALRNPPVEKASLDFGGVSYNRSLATLDIGTLRPSGNGVTLSIISQAQADDLGTISSCSDDRPRSAGLVKSLKNNQSYATSDMLPGLYGRTWHDTVNGNLVVLNKVAVLSNGAKPANPPELKVYANYDPVRDRHAKPTLTLSPAVNTYQGSNGVLYRIFAEGQNGVRCMDILFSQAAQVRAGKIIYTRHNSNFVADFRPRMAGK